MSNPSLDSDNTRARWHREERVSGREAWRCVPLTDAVQAAAVDPVLLEEAYRITVTETDWPLAAGMLPPDSFWRVFARRYAELRG